MSSVVNAADILGAQILSVDEKNVTTEERSTYDVLDTHFYTFTTTKGRADVILHVEHNGYYGGCLCYPEKVKAVPDSAHIPEP